MKAHPDHGGSEEDQKLLNTTRDAWRDAVEQNTPSHQVLIMIPVTEKSLEKIMEMCTTLLVFLFARPETPHHRYESSLNDVSVCVLVFVFGVVRVGWPQKTEMSQSATPDYWIPFMSRHEEHRAGPPIPP